MKKIVSLVIVLACVITAFCVPVNAQMWAQKDSSYVLLAPNMLKNDIENYGLNIITSSQLDYMSTLDQISLNSVPYWVVVLGDVNGDSLVNSTDFMQIRNAYLGLYTFGDIASVAADINGDGKINSTDYILARHHFLGINLITQEETVVFKNHPSVAWKNYIKQFNDYSDEVFSTRALEEKEAQYRDLYKQREEDFKANYTGIEVFENYINELTSHDYNYCGTWYTDDDYVQILNTTSEGFIEKCMTFFESIEVKELNAEEVVQYYDSFKEIEEGTWGSYEIFGFETLKLTFLGLEATYQTPVLHVVGHEDDPFENGLTITYAGHTYLVTNYDDIMYDFYEIYAVLYCQYNNIA